MNNPIFDRLHGYYLEELSIGMDAVFAKTFTEADVLLYSGISGDTNPLHLNEEFASQTRFGTRILHGMLTTSLWSTIVGTLLPGPGCAYMKQELNFYKPVHIGDTVTAKMTITKINAAKQVGAGRHARRLSARRSLCQADTSGSGRGKSG